MLKILLIAAFLNGLVWILLIPVWQYPDEQSHFAQVQNIAEKSKITGYSHNTSYEVALSEEIMGTAIDEFGNNKFTYHPENKTNTSTTTTGPREKEITSLPKASRVEFVKNEATSNPPLYYILAAFFYKIFYNTGLFSRIISIRFFSLLIFMSTILVCYQIGKIIFKNNLLSITLPSMFAFMPMLVFASTGILPDPLTNFFFSVILFYSFKIFSGEIKKNELLILIISIIGGFMTRQQFYLSIPIILFPILFLISKRKDLIKPFIFWIICAVIFIYIVNMYLTSIPLITNFRITDISIFTNNNVSLVSFLRFELWSLKRTYAESMPWFWGIYKWLSLSLPPVYYQIINRIVLVSIFGFLLKFIIVIKEKKYYELKNLIFLSWTPSIYFLILITWNYFFFSKNGFSFGIQGRYYFPAIVPIISILLIGLNNLSKIIFRSYSKYVLFLLISMILVFNIATLIHVSSSYYDTSSLQTFITQVSQYKPILFKGNILIVFIMIALSSQLVFVIRLFKFILKYNENL